MSNYKRYTEKDKIKIIEKYLDENVLVSSILEEWKMTKRTLSRILDNNNVTRRKRGQKPNTRLGESNPRFKGGSYIDKKGYKMIYVPRDDPYYGMRESKNRSYAREHRIVMAKHLGRLLESSETVHHINGNKLDNRIENLQLRRGNHGAGQAWKCHDCGSINIISTKIEGD